MFAEEVTVETCNMLTKKLKRKMRAQKKSNIPENLVGHMYARDSAHGQGSAYAQERPEKALSTSSGQPKSSAQARSKGYGKVTHFLAGS